MQQPKAHNVLFAIGTYDSNIESVLFEILENQKVRTVAEMNIRTFGEASHAIVAEFRRALDVGFVRDSIIACLIWASSESGVLNPCDKVIPSTTNFDPRESSPGSETHDR
jgi:hypothetical protein